MSDDTLLARLDHMRATLDAEHARCIGYEHQLTELRKATVRVANDLDEASPFKGNPRAITSEQARSLCLQLRDALHRCCATTIVNGETVACSMGADHSGEHVRFEHFEAEVHWS